MQEQDAPPGRCAHPQATVNLPADATAADVYHVFQAAWEAGCKGITVYRDGCRSSQPKAL